MSRIFIVLLLFAFGCDDGGGDADTDGGAGMGGGGAGGEGGAPDVPYEGDLPPLPAGQEVDPMNHFPVNDGAVWRYRRKAADFQNPGPVLQGAETTIAPGDEENQVVRETIAIIDLEVDGQLEKVRQVVRETYVSTPAMGAVGPKIEMLRFDVEERVVSDDPARRKLVRKLERRYLPPYTLFSDAWKTGLIDNQIQRNDVRLIEDLTLPGDEEPRHTEGLIELSVVSSADTKVIPMEGRYREDVREVQVFDDFSGTESRTYWVTPGAGLVQWRFRDTNNITFTLTETNLE